MLQFLKALGLITLLGALHGNRQCHEIEEYGGWLSRRNALTMKTTSGIPRGFLRVTNNAVSTSFSGAAFAIVISDIVCKLPPFYCFTLLASGWTELLYLAAGSMDVLAVSGVRFKIGARAGGGRWSGVGYSHIPAKARSARAQHILFFETADIICCASTLRRLLKQPRPNLSCRALNSTPTQVQSPGGTVNSLDDGVWW